MKTSALLIAVLFVAGCSSTPSKTPEASKDAAPGFIETSTSPTIESLNREQNQAKLAAINEELENVNAQISRTQERIQKYSKSKDPTQISLVKDAQKTLPVLQKNKDEILERKKQIETVLGTVY
jgi:hypothetical protein